MTTPITTTTQLEALPAETLLRGGQAGYGPAYVLIWDAGDGRLLHADLTESGYLEPAEVIELHAPLTVLPAPTVKPGRDEVLAALLTVEAGPSTNALADAVLAILPGKTEAQVRAEALRDAQQAIAGEDSITWARAASGSHIMLDHAIGMIDDLIADEEAGK